MDIFQRNSQKGKTMQIIGMIILAASLIAGGILFILQQKSKNTPKEFTDLASNKNQYVNVKCIWFDSLFASVNENSSDKASKRYYIFAQTEKMDFVILELTKDKYDELEAIYQKDPDFKTLDQKPYEFLGTVMEARTGLAVLAQERYAQYEVAERRVLQTNDPEIMYMVREGYFSESSNMIYLLLAILAAAGLITFLTGRKSAQRAKIAKENFTQANGEMPDYQVIDQQAALTIPAEKMTVYGDFLFSEISPFVMVDLRQVSWVYVFRSKGGTSLMVHLLSSKIEDVHLSGSLKKIQEQLTPLYQYMAYYYPNIKIGYNNENSNAHQNVTQ